MIERERQRHRRREKQAPCWEPDTGLDPRTPGSHPGPKAGTKPLSHPGIPSKSFLKIKKIKYQLNLETKMFGICDRGCDEYNIVQGNSCA